MLEDKDIKAKKELEIDETETESEDKKEETPITLNTLNQVTKTKEDKPKEETI